VECKKAKSPANFGVVSRCRSKASRDPMIPDSARLFQFAQCYTAWCSQDPASVAACYSMDGSLCVNGGVPAVGRSDESGWDSNPHRDASYIGRPLSLYGIRTTCVVLFPQHRTLALFTFPGQQPHGHSLPPSCNVFDLPV
jgi:hypothetical protein